MTPNPRNVVYEHERPTSNPCKYQNAYDELRPKDEPRFLMKIRDIEKSMGFLTPLRWTNIIYFFLIHSILLSWLLYDIITGKFTPKWQTLIYLCIFYTVGAFGVTAGVHRYWSHRAFKAKEPLRWILMLCYATSGETTITEWVRDHRIHHKFTETIADPYDSNRGFFFAHIGWLMMKRHPAVIREGRKLDISDVTDDPVVQFHTKHFIILKLLTCYIIPTILPPLLWGECWELSVLTVCLAEFLYGPHVVFSVNSFAHLWGNKPYDPNINPAENIAVSLFAIGEGWHNYHHTFPWDYKTSEHPYLLNMTTLILHFFAAIGWAYDMKQASPEMVQNVIKNRNKENPKEN